MPALKTGNTAQKAADFVVSRRVGHHRRIG